LLPIFRTVYKQKQFQKKEEEKIQKNKKILEENRKIYIIEKNIPE